MITRTFLCPKCNNRLNVQGNIGDKVRIVCSNCGQKGFVVFYKEEPVTKKTGNAIEIKNLTKYYGKYRGVEDISFSVGHGEIFGLIGPNGSGKTTTIRTCLGLMSKTSGDIKIYGLDSHKHSVQLRRRMGYLPGDFGLLPNIKVKQYLKFLLSLSDIKSTKKMEELASRLDLDIKRKTNELSKGNKQKVGIIQALMADQDLLILDEPTTGLDPLIQQEFYKILREEKENGKTVFMSSHILAEVEAVCDRVAIINDGELRIVEEINVLQEKTGKVLEVEFKDQVNVEEFKLPGVGDIKEDDGKVIIVIHEHLDSVIKAVSNHKIRNMTLSTYSLEELFLKYYGKKESVEGGAS